MPVHLYGQMADMPALMEIAQADQLARHRGTRRKRSARKMKHGPPRLPATGDVSAVCPSFPTKNLGAFGRWQACAWPMTPALVGPHGGFCVCTVASRSIFHSLIGGNFRMD